MWKLVSIVVCAILLFGGIALAQDDSGTSSTKAGSQTKTGSSYHLYAPQSVAQSDNGNTSGNVNVGKRNLRYLFHQKVSDAIIMGVSNRGVGWSVNW